MYLYYSIDGVFLTCHKKAAINVVFYSALTRGWPPTASASSLSSWASPPSSSATAATAATTAAAAASCPMMFCPPQVREEDDFYSQPILFPSIKSPIQILSDFGKTVFEGCAVSFQVLLIS